MNVRSVPIVVVGNKTDLHMERMISTEEGKRLAESWKAAFIEASAKQNEVINQVLHEGLLRPYLEKGDIAQKCVSRKQLRKF